MAAKQQVDESNLLINRLNSLPKASARKATHLLDLLKEVGVNYSDEGIVVSAKPHFDEPFDIFPYVAFAVQGKTKPEYWFQFTQLLSEKRIPKSLMCTRAKNGEKTKTASRR